MDCDIKTAGLMHCLLVTPVDDVDDMQKLAETLLRDAFVTLKLYLSSSNWFPLPRFRLTTTTTTGTLMAWKDMKDSFIFSK